MPFFIAKFLDSNRKTCGFDEFLDSNRKTSEYPKFYLFKHTSRFSLHLQIFND